MPERSRQKPTCCVPKLEYKLPAEYRTKFNFTRVIDPIRKTPEDLHRHSEVNISTKRGVEPAFRIEMNLMVGNQPPLFTLETQPEQVTERMAWFDRSRRIASLVTIVHNRVVGKVALVPKARAAKFLDYRLYVN
jgi:hypothetical protein